MQKSTIAIFNLGKKYQVVFTTKMNTIRQMSKISIPKSKGETRKVIKDFCESTSLHGYSYLYNTDSIVLKFVWFIIIMGMTGLGIFFFVENTDAYIKARIVTNIETSSADLSVGSLEM